MVPDLPVDRIRAAIANSDFAQAIALLDEHQRVLSITLGSTDLSSTPREDWLELLLVQRQLLGELQAARDKVEAALARLHQDQRGARAWLRELA